jgi:DNA-binding PadR family transcriptional regulator
MGKGEYLGEFEQLVILAMARLGPLAYGMTIRQEIHERTGRDTAIGSVYAALERLEAKGFVRSTTGEPTPERGGRAKRFFEVTAAGKRAFRSGQSALRSLRSGLSQAWGQQ